MSKRGANEGSIYRRTDGYWVGAISDGPRRRVVYAKTRGEVAAKMKALLHAQQQGAAITMERTSVGAYLSTWLEGARPTVRPRPGPPTPSSPVGT